MRASYSHRIEERAVGIEHAVVEHQRNFVWALRQVERILRAAADDVKAGKPGVVVQPRDA